MSVSPVISGSILDNISFGVGTWAWGDTTFWNYGKDYNDEDIRAVFHATLGAGVNLFDTAEVYGQGRSETLLGKFINSDERKVVVATKFMPFPWRLGRGRLLAALKRSLKRLNLPRVDLYQIHFPFPPISVETWMDAMAEAHQAGLILEVGVSNYNRDQMQRAYDALAHQGIHLASNQVDFSLLKRNVEKNGLLKQCQDLGVKLIAYSPLAQGMLTGKYTPENPPPGIRGGRYNRKYIAQIQPLVEELKKIGAAHAGKTAAQVALNWAICKGTLVIPGAKNLAQAEQNLGALGWNLTADEVAALDSLSDRILEE